MNLEIHIMLCIMFVFSAWVYFLKCEINDLHRRLSDHTGEHAYSTTNDPATSITPALAAMPLRKAHATQQLQPKASHASSGQSGGIPTWTIQ